VKIGQTVTVRAVLQYQDKKGRWQPLNYTSVTMDFEVFSVHYSVVTDQKNGTAKLTVAVPRNTKPSTQTAFVKFKGNSEFKAAMVRCVVKFSVVK
jgi:hypothetical protein